MSPPISCPVVRVPTVMPCEESELDGLVAFLESDASIEEVHQFMRGTLLPDGRLDLCKQSVGPGGCARIASALAGNSRVKSVLLGTDAIGDSGALAVAGLIEANPHLEVVYLGCNGITAQGTGELSRVLCGNTGVKGLWLKRNPIGDGGVYSLAQLLRHNTHLEILDIVNCGFSAASFEELCAALRDGNRTLKRLYAGGNGELSAPALSEMLAHNTALEGLFLNVGALGDEGAAALGQGLKHNRALRELGVGSNGIGAEGLRLLSGAVATHPALEVLDMGRAASQTVLGAHPNDFGGCGEMIASMLRANGKLRRLNLRGTKLSGTDFEPIFDAAAVHPALGELLVDAPLHADVKAQLARTRAVNPLKGDAGVELIKSVYRTVKVNKEPT